MARALYKGLLLIADGLGDRPVPEMGSKTPLEYAATPTLDRLAREGECGLMDPIAPGIRAGSDTAHLAILATTRIACIRGADRLRRWELAWRCAGAMSRCAATSAQWTPRCA